MKEPKGYKDIALGTVLDAGGHKCIIKQVEETKSKSGLDMLIVSFDTAPDDKQPEFYLRRYQADQAAGKDAIWRGRQFVIVDEGTDYGPVNLKRFNTAVEDSNDGFQVVWGDKYAANFKNRKVGIVFRIEEYIDDATREIRAAVKPMRFCNYETAMEQAIPKRKEIPIERPSSDPALAQEGFMQIPDSLADEAGLPFN